MGLYDIDIFDEDIITKRDIIFGILALLSFFSICGVLIYFALKFLGGF